MKLSIIVCTFNEKDTIVEIVNRVQRAELPEGWDREIFIVDNLSIDGTRDILSSLNDYHIIFNKKKLWKGFFC